MLGIKYLKDCDKDLRRMFVEMQTVIITAACGCDPFVVLINASGSHKIKLKCSEAYKAMTTLIDAAANARQRLLMMVQRRVAVRRRQLPRMAAIRVRPVGTEQICFSKRTSLSVINHLGNY